MRRWLNAWQMAARELDEAKTRHLRKWELGHPH